jgi:hypothetical protein
VRFGAFLGSNFCLGMRIHILGISWRIFLSGRWRQRAVSMPAAVRFGILLPTGNPDFGMGHTRAQPLFCWAAVLLRHAHTHTRPHPAFQWRLPAFARNQARVDLP